jgi:nucleoside triphosphate pyrophosphatase
MSRLISPLILASRSPRRRELLAAAGFEFTVRARPVEEVPGDGESPLEYVRRLAREKADAGWESPDEIVLGADTTVVAGDHVLEKPVDAEDARRMLALLSGREHSVITGICLRHAGGAIVDHAETVVRFARLSDTEMDAYVGSGEPMDKAGAYAIQGLASKFVERIDGCYFNVVGLPVQLVYRHWKGLRHAATGT